MRESITLNFLPLRTKQFQITQYCVPFVEGKRPEYKNETAVCRRLEINGNYSKYWTLFRKFPSSTKQVLLPSNNKYLTIDALRLALVRNCEKNIDNNLFSVSTNFRRYVEVVIEEYDEGERIILLEPYFLRSYEQYGFLVNLHFRPKEEYRGTQRALQLSFALDKNKKSNLNNYADRYSQLVAFVKNYRSQIFYLDIPGGDKVEVGSHFVELPAKSLDIKKYVVGSNSESNSQFIGIKNSGPLRGASQDVHLYFIYRQQEHTLSQDLFKALKGGKFATFSGMGNMFNLPISSDNVSGIVISDFTPDSIMRVRDRVVSDAAGRNVIPVIVTPFSKHDGSDRNAAYWDLKHAFLEKNLPIQVVDSSTVADIDKLKWSTAGIGLQIFAKLGGIPWKVKPRLEKCLIIGVGQSHQRSEVRTERYFAYSVLTGSSGVFKEVRILGDNTDENNYIRNFSSNLRQIVKDYSNEYSSFVVHATFAIRRRELEAIAAVLTDAKNESRSGEFVSLKFNDRNPFFGFAVHHNSRVPYESSMIRLSEHEYLVWFEGRQYGHRPLLKMVGNPLHVQFTFPYHGLSMEQQKAHIQDAINLSGANWRGFNAKSLPVSIYYAQLIARYLKEFDHRQLQRIDVEIFKPWFL